jgi:uncharacterized membrane protein YcaP (DUF421 family)
VLVVFIRALILFLVVVIVMRIMGKRQIGQLQPYELAVAIMISELAAVPMQNTGIPLIDGIIPILTILLAQIVFSFASLKSVRLRALICGKPNVLIENGIINEKNLRKEMYTLNELLEQLRINNISNISDVEFAILETNGQLSIIPKSQKRPVIPEDLKIPTQYEGLSIDLIVDGAVMYENLSKVNLNEAWLKEELSKYNINNLNDVFFATLDTQGKLYYQKKIMKGE